MFPISAFCFPLSAFHFPLPEPPGEGHDLLPHPIPILPLHRPRRTPLRQPAILRPLPYLLQQSRLPIPLLWNRITQRPRALLNRATKFRFRAHLLYSFILMEGRVTRVPNRTASVFASATASVTSVFLMFKSGNS